MGQLLNKLPVESFVKTSLRIVETLLRKAAYLKSSCMSWVLVLELLVCAQPSDRAGWLPETRVFHGHRFFIGLALTAFLIRHLR